MARTVAVTKKSVDYTGGDAGKKRYNIVLNLQYLDGATVLIDRDFPLEYITGELPSKYVAEWIRLMQLDIDNYKAEEVIMNTAALNTAVTNIQAALVV